ncbi:hypothetical protein ACFL1Q_02765 [Patescibacteria group bacterium]
MVEHKPFHIQYQELKAQGELTPDETEDVRKTAYFYYLKRIAQNGCGGVLGDWLAAEICVYLNRLPQCTSY